MPDYICERCRKIFSHRGTYERHQSRKFPCVAVDDYHKNGVHGVMEGGHAQKHNLSKILTPVSTEKRPSKSTFSMVDSNTIEKKMAKKLKTKWYECSQKNINNSDYHDTITTKKNISEIQNITFPCNHCHTILKNRNSFLRHIKNCKLRPLSVADLSEIKTKIDKTIVSPVKKSNAQNISNNTTNNITTNNITNNTINNQNIIYVDSRNAEKLLPFGGEDLEYLTNDLMKNIISQPEQGIIKLIQQVHFNEEQPQNQNIQMLNKKEPYLEVFNGEKWEKQDKKIAIQNMITTKKDLMDDFFDEQVEKNIISTFIKKNYETFSDMLDSYVRESLTNYDDNIKSRVVRKCLRLYREICKQAELLMINNKKKIFKEIEKKEIQAIDDNDSDEEDYI